jgi:hemerythrin
VRVLIAGAATAVLGTDRMPRFRLTDELLTGIDGVDQQHRMLFELANRIVDPETERGADVAVFASLAFLSEYVQDHFAAEESAMAAVGYPDRDNHARAHDDFRKLIAVLLEQSLEERNITELRRSLARAVSVWLVHHVRVDDKAMAAYLRALPKTFNWDASIRAPPHGSTTGT